MMSAEMTCCFTWHPAECPSRCHYQFVTEELQLQMLICLERLLSAKASVCISSWIHSQFHGITDQEYTDHPDKHQLHLQPSIPSIARITQRDCRNPIHTCFFLQHCEKPPLFVGISKQLFRLPRAHSETDKGSPQRRTSASHTAQQQTASQDQKDQEHYNTSIDNSHSLQQPSAPRPPSSTKHSPDQLRTSLPQAPSPLYCPAASQEPSYHLSSISSTRCRCSAKPLIGC